MYGDEALVPLELDITSLKISLQGDITDEDSRKARFQQLESLDEKRIRAIEHQKVYHAKLKKSICKGNKGKRVQSGRFSTERVYQ